MMKRSQAQENSLPLKNEFSRKELIKKFVFESVHETVQMVNRDPLLLKTLEDSLFQNRVKNDYHLIYG